MAGVEHGPTLRLIMEKGPLEGQIRDFLPRSGLEIKIGRIVRGNTLAIKDDGISSKHASIRFDLHPGRVGYWAISDLDSSNGTFVNGQDLGSFTPAPLSDGDIIKIGERTSIVVKLEYVTVDVEETKVRRNPVRGKGRNLGVMDEKNENKEDVGGRTRRGKAALQSNEVAEVKGFNEGEMASSKWVTQTAAREINGVEAEFGERENLGRKACSRRNGRRKEEKLDENGVIDAEEIIDLTQEGENFTENEAGKKAKGSRRNGRRKEEKLEENGVQDAEEIVDLTQEGENCNENEVGKKAKGNRKESLKRPKGNLEILGGSDLQNSEAEERVLPIEAKGGENLSLRRTTRNSQKEGNMESLGESRGANTKRGRSRRGKKNLGMETLTENDEAAEIGKEEEVVEKLNSERGEVLEKMKNGFREDAEGLDGLIEEAVQSAADGCEGLASTSGVKENDDIEVDLEKMTLGEWLDFLDVYLPKQIIDATEDMILDMRQKADKFHDFMLEQKNSNKVEVHLV